MRDQFWFLSKVIDFKMVYLLTKLHDFLDSKLLSITVPAVAGIQICFGYLALTCKITNIHLFSE